MYTLFSGLYAHMTQKEEYNVIILGLDNAGKTTLLEQVKQVYLGVRALPPEKITPTVGMNIGKVVVNRSRINLWDLGGQDALRTLWDKYYDECHGIVFVIDSMDHMRLEQCRETFEQIVMNDSAEGVPVLMLANKQDAEGAMRVEEIKEVFNRIALQLGARDSRVLPISALHGEGVQDAVEWLVLRMQRNKEDRPPVFRQA
ncbi:ADP-ribosylation factor family-domain-containing protein [Thamnocephalis sphaerospora]|uniref:ADP-ribosylation factor family-domain-containing protein n=1 Tax=Thamnocephalis sphaerospora TaxID=78915 RepID=A0A4P9XNP5_9FUNG|nr:ADP-ribosylation factor family-domain-containing protein [Thamnocephalis sphaerospora]|eukprot:RKP07565.1 ADP-ribosylation factor family-domain-containing protein [Thamnocephalis sphaerospora]